jgi:HAE1 family hydrophobic/amphiphilic exporter-1
MGFTLNMMTTLALSLSIGILIDDAIVVIENIVRRRTVLKARRRWRRRMRGTAEIGLAVLATTLSIVAVFVPVAFMEGMIGQFFYEFGLTVAFAVLLSLFVSFTLTPMLSARFLGDHHGGRAGSRPHRAPCSSGSTTALPPPHARSRLRHRIVTLGVASAVLVAQLICVARMRLRVHAHPRQVAVPRASIELPPGTSLEATDERAGPSRQRIRESARRLARPSPRSAAATRSQTQRGRDRRLLEPQSRAQPIIRPRAMASHPSASSRARPSSIFVGRGR